MSELQCQNILVIEDNNDIRDTVEDVLRTEGYNVYSVCNGREALLALKKIQGPTLILLDMMMPLMNGWEFLEAQKADAKFANLPVVVVSALGPEAALIKDSEVVNARAYIRKPIDLNTLMNVVQAYCGTPASAESVSSEDANLSEAV